MLTIIVATVFISVALLSGALLYPMMHKREALRNRVDKLVSPQVTTTILTPTRTRWQTFFAEMGSRIKMRTDDLMKYREMISTGGFRIDNVYVFLGVKLFLTALLPALFLIFYAMPRGTSYLFSSNSLPALLVCAIVGYLLPTFWLDKRVKQRKTVIFQTLPDVLDLLTVCVEAGLSLDAALIRTVDNFDKKNPLIEEINRVTLEIRAGRIRAEALRGLAERTMVDDVRSFVAMLLQTEKFGTSLGKTLRTYSDAQRTKRKQIAEEQAAKTATKMLIPLVLCIFPGLLVVILAPALTNIGKAFK